MKASEAQLLQFISKSSQFIIPIYQRPYSWTLKQCEQLWNDIVRTGEDETIASHFLGSIMYIEKGLYQVSRMSPLLVIDGQQRLTTVTLLLVALADYLDTHPEAVTVEGFSPRKIRGYHLINDKEDGDLYYKMLLSETDKDTLNALVNQHEKPADYSLRIDENHQFFKTQLHQNPERVEALCKGLLKLMVVDVALERDKDNPQLIFESMNSTGLDLSQADLIRNFILMGLEPERQTELYTKYWRPMEKEFGQEAYSKSFDHFIRHYLTLKTGVLPNLRDVYGAFKRFTHKQGSLTETVGVLLPELRHFAHYYCCITQGIESDAELKQAFRDLKELKVDVSYGLMLELYADYASGQLSKADFVQAIRLVESYVFRRAICNIPTNSLNKTFANFSKSLDKSRYLASFQEHLWSLPSYRRFPDDAEFKKELVSRNVYHFRSNRYLLRRLENAGRKEPVAINEYTLEHILPQNPKLSTEWQLALGPDWQRIQETYLHTLGNLTLTGYNSEYADKPFAQKRDMQGGFAESPLRLNHMLRTLDQWNEAAIRERAHELAGKACEIWSAPEAAYKPEKSLPQTQNANNPLQDHLLKSPNQELFNALRHEILALDPCVNEEILKYYVAYKAETNFVDVEGYSSKIKLYLNLPFQALEDPRGWAKDVTHIGTRGNGDISVDYTDMSQVPYLMGLIRQSFDSQINADEED